MKKRIKLIIKTIFLYELLQGLVVTLKHMFRKKVTIQYPEEKTPFSPRFRGALALRRYPSGEERCISCKLCEAVCPAAAITIESEPREDNSRRSTRFDIDMFKCINCGFCEESCPVNSIVVTPMQHYCFDEKGKNIVNKEQLLAIGDKYESKILSDWKHKSKYS